MHVKLPTMKGGAVVAYITYWPHWHLTSWGSGGSDCYPILRKQSVNEPKKHSRWIEIWMRRALARCWKFSKSIICISKQSAETATDWFFLTHQWSVASVPVITAAKATLQLNLNYPLLTVSLKPFLHMMKAHRAHRAAANPKPWSTWVRLESETINMIKLFIAHFLARTTVVLK